MNGMSTDGSVCLMNGNVCPFVCVSVCVIFHFLWLSLCLLVCVCVIFHFLMAVPLSL